MYRSRVFSILAVAALVACALVPTSASAVSREGAVARGRVWLNAVRVDPITKRVSIGVPYSQSKWALENGSAAPTSSPTAGYRTDCSGFVSMCWNLRGSNGKPYSTSTYEMGRNQSTVFKLTPIGKAQLQPGDLMLKSTVWYPSGTGHAVLFAGWADAGMSTYWALEQTSPGTKYSKRPYGQTGYRAFRYNGIEGFSRTRVPYGGTFTVDGTAYRTPNASGSVVATGGAVDLALCASDGSLSFVATNVRVDSTGHFSITYAPQKTGRFAVRYRSLDVSNQSTVLPAVTVTVAPNVSSVGGSRSVIRRKRTYGFSGSVNPRVATSLRVYRYNSRTRSYLYYKTIRASVGSRRYSSGYRLSAKWKPRVAGKYRIAWLTGSPTGMTFSASGNRYVTVK
jgi:hypothetical protein